MSVTSCSICGKPAMTDNGPVGDIVDCFKYDFDGSLDYIMLMHRKCALAKGYKIKNDRVVTGHWAERNESQQVAEYPQVNEALPHDEPTPAKGQYWKAADGGDYGYVIDGPKKANGDVPVRTVIKGKETGERRNIEAFKLTYRYSYVRDSLNEALPEPGEQNPIKEDVKRVPFKYSVERVKGTLDYRIVDTQTRKPVGGTYRTKDYDGDDLDSLKAANSRCAQMNRDWADKQDPPVQMREARAVRYIVRRIPNTMNFVVVDLDAGKTIDTYLERDFPREGPQLAAQRDADELNRMIGRVHRIGEMSDAAPAIAKNECSVTRQFGKTRLEVAPPGKESWVKSNKARFKKQYGAKKGTEVLYATAWKNKNK